jgi:CheY-like chemotaxis protein
MADRAPYIAVTFSQQPAVAYFLRGVLECAGLTVTSATFTAQDLEATVTRRRPDVIVCDVSSPFRENWAVIEQLQRGELFQNIPVVITTSESTQLRSIGVSPTLELCARPEDVSAVRSAVLRAIEAAPEEGRRSAPPSGGADFRLATAS